MIHANVALRAGNSAFRRVDALSAFRAVLLSAFYVDKQNTKPNLALMDDAVTLCACSVTKPTDVLCFVVWPTCCDGGK
jgi:hypothetical protein